MYDEKHQLNNRLMVYTTSSLKSDVSFAMYQSRLDLIKRDNTYVNRLNNTVSATQFISSIGDLMLDRFDKLLDELCLKINKSKREFKFRYCHIKVSIKYPFTHDASVKLINELYRMVSKETFFGEYHIMPYIVVRQSIGKPIESTYTYVNIFIPEIDVDCSKRLNIAHPNFYKSMESFMKQKIRYLVDMGIVNTDDKILDMLYNNYMVKIDGELEAINEMGFKKVPKDNYRRYVSIGTPNENGEYEW